MSILGWHNRVFANSLGDRSSIPGRVTLNIKKRYLILPCLTPNIIKYGSRVSRVIQGKEDSPPLHLGVIGIVEDAFGLPLTTVGQLIYIHFFFLDEK